MAVTNYGNKRSNWRVKVLRDPKTPEPPAENFAEIAKAQGLILLNTGLVSRETLLKSSDLKTALIPRENQSPLFFANKVYSGSMPEYKPEYAEDVVGNLLMIWQTEEQKEQVPEFAKVKPEVLQVWKTMEARKFAKAEADRLVELAKKDPSLPLKESLGKEKEVKEIGPFSWKVGNLFNKTVVTSTVFGIDDAGDEFMRAVYALDEGGIGTAWNLPKTACFVVRVDHWERSLTVLFSEFQKEVGSRRFVDNAAYQALGLRWLDSLKEEFGLKMDKNYDLGRERQETPGAPVPVDDEG